MLVPVIHFNGCCADAIALYEKAFTVTDKHVDYYRDAPDNSGMDVSESTQNLIMHSRMAINGTYINMSDDMSDGFVPQHLSLPKTSCYCITVHESRITAKVRPLPGFCKWNTIRNPKGTQLR